MKTIELFAGIGGFRLAAEENNIETVWANDIDEKAVSVYKYNFGENSIVEGDIHKYLGEIPAHDILTGGFPCQPFSKAGKKKGIDDYRGTLFEVIVNILEEKQPKFFILENVNSLLYMNNGSHFKTILSALSSLDYKIEWRVFNAVSFGLPQHRERVIILGSKVNKFNESYFLDKDEEEKIPNKVVDEISRYNRWHSIEDSKNKFKNWGMAINGFFVTESVAEKNYKPQIKLKDIMEEDYKPEFDFTEDTLNRIKNSDYVNKFYNGVQILYNQAGGARMGYTIFGTEGTSPTLTASSSRHYERYKVGDKFRRLTNIEYARLQGFPDHHCDNILPYHQYKLYGNAVPHQIISFALNRLINDKYITINKRELNLFDLGYENA